MSPQNELVSKPFLGEQYERKRSDTYRQFMNDNFWLVSSYVPKNIQKHLRVSFTVTPFFYGYGIMRRGLFDARIVVAVQKGEFNFFPNGIKNWFPVFGKYPLNNGDT